jgi:hypothetical protein
MPSHQRRENRTKSIPLPRHFLVLLWLLAPVLQADDRHIFDGSSHGWLAAVGSLQVPGQRYENGRTLHYLEDCSATLIAPDSGGKASTVVTAWHCLEHYRDLSRPILFTLPLPGADQLQIEARKLADGGGMHADWAILRLREPVAATTALAVYPGDVSPGDDVTMAGYSKDPGLGGNGRHLTFDATCRVTARSKRSADTDCIAHKGASGGAVIQLSINGEPLYGGVISAGDGAGLSRYVPVQLFRKVLMTHLR